MFIPSGSIRPGVFAVFIDWANVYGWTKSLKKEVDPKKLFKNLKHYPKIEEINFYSGVDKHPKSKEFLGRVKQIGFNVVSKEVKYIPVSLDSSHFKNLSQEVKNSLSLIKNLEAKDIEKILQILSRKVLRRKCDFAPLYKLLINLHKQVIVIFAHGHMGKEVYQIEKGIFTKAVDKLGVDLFV